MSKVKTTTKQKKEKKPRPIYRGVQVGSLIMNVIFIGLFTVCVYFGLADGNRSQTLNDISYIAFIIGPILLAFSIVGSFVNHEKVGQSFIFIKNILLFAAALTIGAIILNEAKHDAVHFVGFMDKLKNAHDGLKILAAIFFPITILIILVALLTDIIILFFGVMLVILAGVSLTTLIVETKYLQRRFSDDPYGIKKKLMKVNKKRIKKGLEPLEMPKE
jgi:hypothetical protein